MEGARPLIRNDERRQSQLVLPLLQYRDDSIPMAIWDLPHELLAVELSLQP